MPRLRLKKQFGKLVAFDDQSKAYLDGLPNDAYVDVDIKQPRNVGHHKKYFALLNILFNNQSIYESFEAFRAAMACAVGYGDNVKLPDGREILVPKSISFAKMDQIAFNEFWELNMKIVCTKILPGVDRDDLEAEIIEFIA